MWLVGARADARFGDDASSSVSTPRKPREPFGNDRERSEPVGNRSAGQAPFESRSSWSQNRPSQIPKPCVAGSNPAEGTSKYAGQRLFLDTVCRPTYAVKHEKPAKNPRTTRKCRLMAHIRKHSRRGKDGGRRTAYEVRYRDPSGRERSRTFPRRIDAERFASTIDADSARGQYVDPVLGKTSFAEFSREWLVTTGHLRPKTREGYESILRTHLLPAFGDQPIAKVRPG
jgi:hypothetical protein